MIKKVRISQREIVNTGRNYRYCLLLFILISGFFLSLAIAWSRLYYSSGPTLIERVSFTANDPSWMPRGPVVKPIMGQHYFGDLELLFGWARSSNPYDVGLNAQFLPIGKFFLLPFAFMNSKLGLFFYFILSIGLLYFSWVKFIQQNQKISTKLSKLEYFPIFAFTGLFSLPLLVDLDRGNLYTISLSALILAIVSIQSKNRSASIFWSLLATAFKPYFAICILLFLIFGERKKIRDIVYICLSLFVINFLLMAMLPGSLIHNTKNLLIANARYGGRGGVGLMFNSGSLTGLICRWVEQACGSDCAVKLISNHLIVIYVVTIMYLVFAIMVFKNLAIELPFRLFALLSIISVVQPGSGAYTWGWITFVATAWVLNSRRLSDSLFANISLISIIFLSVIPIWLQGNHFMNVARNYPQYLVLSFEC
jgi:hypothetical protein